MRKIQFAVDAGVLRRQGSPSEGIGVVSQVFPRRRWSALQGI